MGKWFAKWFAKALGEDTSTGSENVDTDQESENLNADPEDEGDDDQGKKGRLSSRMPEEFERLLALSTGNSTWIGVDLDGTLSHETEQFSLDYINPPVPQMLMRVKDWTEQGYVIKIMTARASVKGGIKPVEKWLVKYGLAGLEVTNAKDFNMIELWDDRGVQVIANTGNPVGPSRIEQILDAEEAANQGVDDKDNQE